MMILGAMRCRGAVKILYISTIFTCFTSLLDPFRPSCGALVFVPHMYPTWGTWGTYVKYRAFWVTIFFFFCPFCYKNVEKMFYQPQKVTLSPQKVKKVKKIKKKLFFTYCVRKSHIYTYIFEFWPPM